jgi:hypothetical protein
LRFEDEDEPEAQRERSTVRKPTGFVSGVALPPEEDEDEEEQKPQFAAPEDGSEHPEATLERRERRTPTGFVKLGELPEEDEEGKPHFEEREDGSEHPELTRQRSERRTPTGFVSAGALPPGDDEGKPRFAEPEDGSEQPEAKRDRRQRRVPTGFVKISELPEEDEEDDEVQRQLRFAEPDDGSEQPEGKAVRREKRTPTGFVKLGELPPDEEDSEQVRKPRFAEPEDGSEQPEAKRERSARRTPTGFVKINELPAEDEDDDEVQRKLRFAEPEDGSEQPEAHVARKERRTPTGFVRPSVLPLDEDEEGDEAPAAEMNEVAEKINSARLCSALNEGEQGEEDDPEDEDLLHRAPATVSAGSDQGQFGALSLKKSASAPVGTLAGSLAVARRQNIPSHIKKGKPKLRPPIGCTRSKIPPPLEEWDERHHLSGGENELLPKKLRMYFQRPQEWHELREDLEQRNNMNAMLKAMDGPEVPYTKPTPIGADAGPPVIPHKHEPGGSMKDRDQEVRLWNNRWSQGIQILNEGMHPMHREYFTQPSLFATAPSQRWRRYQDTEVARGEWKTNQEKRPARFPPLGL